MIDTALLDQLIAEAHADGVRQLVVGGIVQDGDYVLLLRRLADDFMGGIYELPSGKVDPDEPLDAALVREIKEETGLDVATIGAYLGSFDYESGSGKKSRQFTFAVDVAATGPVVLTEHDKHMWSSLADELPVSEAVKAVLDSYRTTRRETGGS